MEKKMEKFVGKKKSKITKKKEKSAARWKALPV
jgi:hypothetical protein